VKNQKKAQEVGLQVGHFYTRIASKSEAVLGARQQAGAIWLLGLTPSFGRTIFRLLEVDISIS
jgi:hypothetical protein